MRVPSLLRRLARLGSGGTILCYHSIVTEDAPGEGLTHVSPEMLRRDLEVLRALCKIVPLQDLLDRHGSGRDTEGLVALTFDDAYAALSTNAASDLFSHNVPLTIFVTTHASRSGKPFWWDRIDDVFPHVEQGRWRRFERQCEVPESYRSSQKPSLGPLRPLRQWILAEYHGRWPRHFEEALVSLEEETGTRTVQRPMTIAEVRAVARHPAVSIGVHTVSHPVLPLLGDQELRQEVRDSFRTLREWVPETLPVLAVPFGLFDRRTLGIARAEGMKYSLTLGARSLRHPIEPGGLARFCRMRTDPALALPMNVLGIRERLRPVDPEFPALPSAST